ncbi:6-phosphogluconolactonase [Candidatus Sumerlaeota bacterium]|nr:6-phosphogluconolactonase [Candidatus Sumerlaeota bacterium]
MKQQPGILGSAGDVAREGARIAVAAAREKPGAAIALSGGSTPKAMYEILRESGGDDAKALLAAQYFFGDERSVDNYHPDSNVALAMNEFMRALRVPYRQVEAPDGAARDLDAEAMRLTRRLHERCAPDDNGTPVFDLVFLGMGTDGHTASLFPGTLGLASDTPGFIANQVPQLSTWRLTLTFRVINAARRVIILCTGENKAPIVKRIFEGTGDEFPITRVAGANVLWLLDDGAASQLRREAAGG